MPIRRVLLLMITSSLVINLFSCDYIKQERDKEVTFAKLGANYNPIRKECKLSLLPDSGWVKGGIVYNGDFGLCRFFKKSPYDDSSARWAAKEIYFVKNRNEPVRETDTYYSGRKYQTPDPDNYDWERVEISYSYTSDSLVQIYKLKSGFYQPALLQKGKRHATLVGPRPNSRIIGNDSTPVTVMVLENRSITMIQADSTLKKWGLIR